MGMQPCWAMRVSLLAALGLLPACAGKSDESKPELEAEAGAGGDAATAKVSPCSSPELDAATGLVHCAEGYVHRPSPSVCGSASDAPSSLPRAMSEDCAADPGVCEQFAYGYCRTMGSPIGNVSRCVSGCSSDAECGPGAACKCGGPSSTVPGVCVSAACHADADCESGRCVGSTDECGADVFVCRAAGDSCQNDSDCAGGTCAIDDGPAGGGHRLCKPPGCAIGRPFLVESQLRFAPLVGSETWHDSELRPSVAQLTAAERGVAAAYWARMGQLEHASIAAFARFQLQLLALGAPPELVEACTSAMADETAHAKLCFGFASAFAGRALGPGPLDITRSLSETSLCEVVELVVAEGCIGETEAALGALADAETTDDPPLRTAYARIARDEQRHAELAFRFVAWALQQDRAGVAACIERQLGRAGEGRALREVVRPCLMALLSADVPRRVRERPLHDAV